ncbi:MAG: glucoamylase family protein [Dysgonamonadaceae bacterium]|nr:glucoamylase family protein [Dysgonamonadaceae bacterium]
MKNVCYSLMVLLFFFASCKENGTEPIVKPPKLTINEVRINGRQWFNNSTVTDISITQKPIAEIKFSKAFDIAKFNKSMVSFSGEIGQNYNIAGSSDNKTLIINVNVLPKELTKYSFNINQGDNLGGYVNPNFSAEFTTQLDSTYKFPEIANEELLTLVQKQTFKYFWDYGHPVSGLARERLSSGETVTMGGSGFGIMAVIVGIERGFITRQQGFERLNKIVNFLSNNADRFHGAFPHWMNGSTGKVLPFSTKDDGADLIETAFLIQGLLTIQSYFDTGNNDEQIMCSNIQKLWEEVEWNWFQKNNENVLYWHWSPNYNWDMNMHITGWNEGLIAYVLAASSPTFPISKNVYTEGWAKNGAIKNGNKYYDIKLPLGENLGGPLFFAHYSFLGLDPRNLSDQYASYWEQNMAHSKINYNYCVNNPNHFVGYSKDCWGLSASDIPGGYTASSPTNDNGTITPTAALASFPYTPTESMRALNFYYYVLGDKLWGDYGFKDAFNLSNKWVADSYLAIDQGPIIVMIENYRSALLWNLFMKQQDIKNGLTMLGFSY